MNPLARRFTNHDSGPECHHNIISLVHCFNTVRKILAASIICKTSSWNILRPKLVKSEVSPVCVQTLLPKAADPYDCPQALLFCDLQSVIKRNDFAVHKYMYDLFYYKSFANNNGELRFYLWTMNLYKCIL